MIRRLWKVAFAEWKLIYTDPAAVLLLVVAGLIYAFYYPVPYVYQTVSKVPVAVVDLDNTAMSRELVRMASAAQQIEVKAIYPEMKQAEAAMARDEIYGFMVIPENMEKNIRGKHQTTVNIFTHGAYVMFHGAIGTAFSTCALTVGATNKVKQIAISKQVPSTKAIAMRDPFPVSIQTLYNSTGGYANYVVPSGLSSSASACWVVPVLTGASARSFVTALSRTSPCLTAISGARWLILSIIARLSCSITALSTTSSISRVVANFYPWWFSLWCSSRPSSISAWSYRRCFCAVSPACSSFCTCPFRCCSLRISAGPLT